MRFPVFISWSGERSRLFARKLKPWLAQTVPPVIPWMSEADMRKGSQWGTELHKKLRETTFSILCITPENADAPWLNYEAGAIANAIGSSSVCPLLLGMSPSDITGPLAQFQVTTLQKRDVLQLLRNLNEQLIHDKLSVPQLKRRFDLRWRDLANAARSALKAPLAADSRTLPNVVEVFKKSGVSRPAIGVSAYFESGFESHPLYEVVTRTAVRRFYNFSRLNRKILDKNYADFYAELGDRAKAGFDFKLLFMDPDAPDHVIRAAHRDADFRKQLRQSIRQARLHFAHYGLDADAHCRTYKVVRTVAMTIVDDAVIFAPEVRDSSGVSRRLTKASFTILHASTGLGKELIEYFSATWKQGSLLP